MARPVEYNKPFVLQKAMEIFWIKGYATASMSDLLDSTGLTSRSLYNIFGSKNGLFKEVLEKYYQIRFGPALEKLENGTGKAAVRTFVEDMASEKPLNGCLFVNTFSDRNCVEKDNLKLVQDVFMKLELALEQKLVEAGEFENFSGSPSKTAKQLMIFSHGLAIYSITNITTSEQHDLATDFLELLNL